MPGTMVGGAGAWIRFIERHRGRRTFPAWFIRKWDVWQLKAFVRAVRRLKAEGKLEPTPNHGKESHMKKLEEVLGVDKAVPCPGCGGLVFFDWGLKLLHTERGGTGPRVQDWATSGNVQICASCHHPVVWQGGDYYDAEAFIPKDTVEKLILEGQARHHQVPVRAMDP